MNTIRHSHTVRRALLALALLTSVDAMAQVGRYDPNQRREHAHHAEEAKEATQFPNATRVAPAQEASKAGGKALNAIVAAYQAKQYPQVFEQVDALAASSKVPYERSFAFQLAGTAAVDAGDNEKAIAYFRKAIEGNGLSNDQHYPVMFNLAVTQYQAQHPADAMATLDRLQAETKAEKPEYATLRAALLAALNHPAEAAAVFEKIYAANPTNTRALMNAAAAYQQANQMDKATALLDTARQKGALTDASQYRALYAAYANANQPEKAQAVIDEGTAKGLVTPSPDLAQAYSVLAQNAYAKGDVAKAIALYQKAAPMAADGTAALNLASVLWNEKRFPEARTAAQLALQKGLDATHAAQARKLAAKGGK